MFKLAIVCLALAGVALAQDGTCDPALFQCDTSAAGTTRIRCANVATMWQNAQWDSTCVPNNQDTFCNDNPCRAPLNSRDPCAARIYSDAAFAVRKCDDNGKDLTTNSCANGGTCDSTSKPADVTCYKADGSSSTLAPVCNDKCEWESRPCPPVECPPCSNGCSNGYELDPTTNCPVRTNPGTSSAECTCRASTCDRTQCPQLTCAATEAVFQDPNKCCPECKPACDSSLCPATNCPTGTYEYRDPNKCCAECRPIDPCATNTGGAITCTNEPATCPTGYERVKDGCCYTCKERPDCNALTSANTCPSVTNCDATTHKVVLRDGACCPECLPLPPCSDVNCALAGACPTGTVSTPSDLSCCDKCEPADKCLQVTCPVNIQCDYRYRKDGDCCDTCVFCKTEYDNNQRPVKVCDNRDNTVCAAGYTVRDQSTGACVPETDPTQIETREIEIIAKPKPDGSCYSVEEIKRRLTMAHQTGASALDPATIHIVADATRVDRNGELWCRYKIVVTYRKGTADANSNTFAQGSANTDSAIAADSDMATYTPPATTSAQTEPSAASTAAVSVALVAGAAILA